MCRMPTNSSRVLWESRTIQIIEPICSTAGSPISITNETMPGFLTTSGSSLWMGYPYSWGEKGLEDHCDGGGAGAFGSHHRRPEYEAEIRVAGADRAAVGRGCWHDGDRASGRQIQARGVAVAGTVRRRRRGWLAARPATFGAASDGRAGPGACGGGAHAAHGAA